MAISTSANQVFQSLLAIAKGEQVETALNLITQTLLVNTPSDADCKTDLAKLHQPEIIVAKYLERLFGLNPNTTNDNELMNQIKNNAFLSWIERSMNRFLIYMFINTVDTSSEPIPNHQIIQGLIEKIMGTANTNIFTRRFNDLCDDALNVGLSDAVGEPFITLVNQATGLSLATDDLKMMDNPLIEKLENQGARNLEYLPF